MRVPVLFIIAGVLLSAQLSVQAPPAKHPTDTLTTGPLYPESISSLLDIVHSRPVFNKGKAAMEYKEKFAQHPDIAALKQKSTKEDFLKHALQLRKGLEKSETVTKKRFLRSMHHYLKDDNHIDKELQEDVKAILTLQSRRERSQKYHHKPIPEKDLEVVRARRSRNNALHYARTKQRKQDQASLDMLPIEAKIKSLNLPPDATAKQIVDRFHGSMVENNWYTTPLLRKYLNERFDPSQVRIAMASRSYKLMRSNYSKYTKAGREAESLKSAHSQSSEPASASTSNPDSDKQASTSSHDNVDPTSKHFHPAEWWDTLY